MAGFLAGVNATFQLLRARKATADFGEPAGLVLEGFLAADANFLDEEWAFGTRFCVGVACVLDLGVATGSLASAFIGTGWRLCSAWLWRVESCSAAGTADFVKYSLEAGRARPFVA